MTLGRLLWRGSWNFGAQGALIIDQCSHRGLAVKQKRRFACAQACTARFEHKFQGSSCPLVSKEFLIRRFKTRGFDQSTIAAAAILSRFPS